MIGKVKGTLLSIEGNIGLIQTPSGIAYEVFLHPAVLNHPLNTEFEVDTYFHVREDVQILFGFRTLREKLLFKMLIGVSGVGPKTAFQVISFSNEDDFIRAIKENDAEYFSRVPGLGKKTALKIILELSSKMNTEFEIKQLVVSEEDKTVIDALVSLGFKSQEAKQIFQKIPKDLTLEQKITAGIRLATNKN